MKIDPRAASKANLIFSMAAFVAFLLFVCVAGRESGNGIFAVETFDRPILGSRSSRGCAWVFFLMEAIVIVSFCWAKLSFKIETLAEKGVRWACCVSRVFPSFLEWGGFTPPDKEHAQREIFTCAFMFGTVGLVTMVMSMVGGWMHLFERNVFDAIVWLYIWSSDLFYGWPSRNYGNA